MDAAYQQQMIEMIGEGLLQQAEIEEKKLDAQLAKLENLGKSC